MDACPLDAHVPPFVPEGVVPPASPFGSLGAEGLGRSGAALV